MEAIVGIDDPWTSVQLPFNITNLRTSDFYPGLQLELVNSGVYASGDEYSYEYLKLLLFGTLKTLARFNNPGVPQNILIRRCIDAVKNYGFAPRSKNNKDESILVHSLWLNSESDFYQRTRIHGQAVIPTLWSSTDISIDEHAQNTHRLWQTTNPRVFDIAPGGWHPGYSSEAPAFEKVTRAKKHYNDAVATESESVTAIGPRRLCKKETKVPIPGHEKVVWLRNHASPDVKSYEDFFSFAAPVFNEYQSSAKRGNFLPNVGSNVRRIFVKQTIRIFLAQQCRLDLNAAHYAFLIGKNVLPSYPPDGYERSVFRFPWFNDSYREDRRGLSSPFRSIQGYRTYTNTLHAHMHAFQRHCFPHVMEPLDKMATDSAWTENFPLTMQEIVFYIVTVLDETYRYNFYRNKIVAEYYNDDQQTWLDRQIQHFNNSLEFTGVLNVLVRERNIRITDELLKTAWEEWLSWNTFDQNLQVMDNDALTKARIKLRHIRRMLPNKKSNVLPDDCIMILNKMRDCVMARYRVWQQSYFPFRDENVHDTYKQIARNMNRTFGRRMRSSRPLPNDNDRFAYTFHEHICLASADEFGTLLNLLSESDDYATAFFFKYFDIDELFWERQFPYNQAVAVGTYLLRDTFLTFTWFDNFFIAAMGKRQTDAREPTTYTVDYSDLERDLQIKDIMLNESEPVLGVHNINSQDYSTFKRGTFCVWVMHLPWLRNWTSSDWRVTLSSDDEYEGVSGNLPGTMDVPFWWVLGKYRYYLRPIDMKYSISLTYVCKHNPPRALYDTKVLGEFVKKGQISFTVNKNK